MACRHNYKIIDGVYQCQYCHNVSIVPPQQVKENHGPNIIVIMASIFIALIIGIIILISMDLIPNVSIFDNEGMLGTIYYGVIELPDVPNPSILSTSTDIAVKRWMSANPELILVQDNVNPQISIEYSKNFPSTHTECNDTPCKVIVEIGDYDCNGVYVQYDTNWVSTRVMHEIGHGLGLGHSPNPTHLMHGIDPDDTFETNLNVPGELPGGFVGQQELKNNLNDVKIDIDKLNSQRDELLSNASEIADAYGYTMEGIISNPNDDYPDEMEDELTPILERVNDITITMNDLILKETDITEKFNCYPNVP